MLWSAGATGPALRLKAGCSCNIEKNGGFPGCNGKCPGFSPWRTAKTCRSMLFGSLQSCIGPSRQRGRQGCAGADTVAGPRSADRGASPDASPRGASQPPFPVDRHREEGGDDQGEDDDDEKPVGFVLQGDRDVHAEETCDHRRDGKDDGYRGEEF